MARRICIEVLSAPNPIGMTVPGMGTVQTQRPFQLGGYNSCADAHAFLAGLQPILAGLGMPLCLLSCLTSVIEVFSSDFPYVNPAALTKIPQKCFCLSSFTPFGFCGLLRGIVRGLVSVLHCFTGIIGDIIRMEAQAASLVSNPETAYAGQCLQGQSQTLLQNAKKDFAPVMQLFNASAFLFSFVGVTQSSVPSLGDGDAASTLAAITAMLKSMEMLMLSINAICPGG
jgi:hypothetical protein